MWASIYVWNPLRCLKAWLVIGTRFFGFFSKNAKKLLLTQTSFQGFKESLPISCNFCFCPNARQEAPKQTRPISLLTTHMYKLYLWSFQAQSFTCKEAMMKVEEETCSSRTENVNYISNNLCQYGATSKGQIVGPQEDSMILSKTSLPKIDELIKTFIRHNCNTCGQLVGFSDAKVRNQRFFLSPFHLCSPKSRLLFFII